jgi:hypothetical protein
MSQKTIHFFIPVFVTPEGEIYVNFSVRNNEGKVIFKRIEADKYYGRNKGIDWDIKIGVKEVVFNLQKDGLEICGDNDMVVFIRGISENLKSQENYFFTAVSKSTKNMMNENLVLMSLEDFLADEEIDGVEKTAVEYFYNGDAVNQLTE